MNDMAHTFRPAPATGLHFQKTRALWTRIVAYGETNRFGMICLALLLVGCMGGTTMAFGASHYIGALIAVLIPTMATLSSCLAVAPFRFILLSFTAAVVTDTIVCIALIV